MSITYPLTIIGTVDRIDLTEFNLENVECKIDTGADSSTIHCSDIHIIDSEGIKLLKFKVLDHVHDAYHGAWHSFEKFTTKKVRSSFGDSEERFSIRTKVQLFNRIYPIDLTLSDRKKMKYPMLIGKKFLKQHFLVDVTQKDLSYHLKTLTNKSN